MSTTNDSIRLVDDLAGHWTDPALAILKASGIGAVSVDMEVETWRSLQSVLQGELRRQPPFRLYTPGAVDVVMGRVLRRATLLVVRKFLPWSDPAEWESRIEPLADEHRSTAAERALFFRMVRQPLAKALARLPRRTDTFPRLHASAI